VAGLKRLKPENPKQAWPITPDILTSILGVLDLSRPDDARFWAYCTIAFFGFLRKSSLLVKSQAAFSTQHLRRSDIRITPESLVLILRRSKTIQFGDRVVPIVISAVPGSFLCPRAAYLNYLRLVPAPDSCPFLGPASNPFQAPTYTWFEERLRKALTAAGIVGYYTGHSFRRGGATFAFRCGVPAFLIKLQGDWHSDAYLLYTFTPVHIRRHCSATMAAALTDFTM